MTISGLNNAPALDGSSSLSIMENQSAVATLTATDDFDAIGSGLAFSIVSGSDAALFSVDATTGQLAFIQTPDYEKPQDVDHNNVYDLNVRVSDSQ